MLYAQKGIDELVVKNYLCYKNMPGNWYLVKTGKNPKFVDPSKLSRNDNWDISDEAFYTVSVGVDIFAEGYYVKQRSKFAVEIWNLTFGEFTVEYHHEVNFHKNKTFVRELETVKI